MTRKRFVKKIMGFGVPRNAAQNMAASRPKHMSYEHWYSLSLFGAALAGTGTRIKRASKAFKKLGEAASNSAAMGCHFNIIIADEMATAHLEHTEEA